MAEEPDFQPEKLSEDAYLLVAAIYALLAFVAFALNSLVIFAFVRDRSLIIPSNLPILSISIADWLMAVVANPLGVAANVSDAWSLRGTTCTFYAFVTTTLAFGVMMHHTAIAVEKYLVIARPYKKHTSNKAMLAVIAFLWLFSLLWSGFPLLGWSAYVPEASNTACSINWQSADGTDSAYIYAIFSVFYFAPIAIITSAYALIYRHVRQMSQRAIKMWGTNSNPTLDILKSKAKTAKMSCLMVTGFMVGWTPYAVVSLLAARGGVRDLSPAFAVIPAMFAKTTTSYNPVIYCFMYDGFRTSLKMSIVNGRHTMQPNDV